MSFFVVSRRLVVGTVALVIVAMPAAGRTLQTQIAARLAALSPGTRFGLMVADADGREIVALHPDERFIPASNAKIFITAAVFATLPKLDQPDAAGGVSARLEGNSRAPDVVLEGHGDARLSSAPDCREDCLETLADAIARATRVARDVIGDDGLFPDERWSLGMSWNNIPTRSGTGISALTIDDNEAPLRVSPGAVGRPPIVDPPAFFTVENRAVTVAGGTTALAFDRAPNSDVVRLTGTIPAGAPPRTLMLGVDDPARYAAWRLRDLLRARGVRVLGDVSVRHRPLAPADDPARRGGAPAATPPRAPALASLSPPPLERDLTITNTASQNLHAELLLRRLGLLTGNGSVADGLAVVRDVAARAGVPRLAYDLSDGSGMSTYDRVTPRGMVTLLRWIAGQPWGERWRATLPVGGRGTLARRFRDAPLAGKLWAKTGSLNATSALSGYLVAASGRTLTFALYANDVPDGASAIPAMDEALRMVAAAN